MHKATGRRLSLLMLAFASSAAGAEGPARWSNCLAPGGSAVWAAVDGAERRQVDGRLEVRSAEGKGWATIGLREALPAHFELEVELRWTPRRRGASGSVEVALGPHGVGSAGYRFVVRQRPWLVVECRGPLLAQGVWHVLRLRGSPGWLAYWLGDVLVVRCPAEGTGRLELAVAPNTEVALRRCRVRPLDRAEMAATDGEPLFAYGAARFDHRGRVVKDSAARTAEAVELSGAGLEQWLVWGQDASLPRGGLYAAAFGLRAIRGAGRVRLVVARSGGAVVAERTLSVAELPVKQFRRTAVPFRYEPGWTMEYRVAVERDAAVRLEGVRVAARGSGGAGAAGALARKPRLRRPPALEKAWPARAKTRTGRGLAIVRLERRMSADGAYRVSVVWKQDAAASVDGVSVDMWVSCRDDWGRVRTFDYGAAYDAVARGIHQTAAELDGRRCAAYGVPGSLFVQLYRGGAPVASAWRKWGIPVEDKWILPAQRMGRLSEVGGF